MSTYYDLVTSQRTKLDDIKVSLVDKIKEDAVSDGAKGHTYLNKLKQSLKPSRTGA